MSYYRLVLAFLFSGISIVSCQSDTEYFLNGGYSYVDDRVETCRIQGTEVPGSDGYDAIRIAICDTLGFFYSWKYPDGFVSVLHVETGEEFGVYCPKGRGPLETTGMSPIHDLRYERGMLRAEILDVHRQRLLVWNITESLDKGRTIYDTVSPMTTKTIYQWCSKIDNERYFTCSAAIPFEDIREVVAPKYAVVSLMDGRKEREYQLFRDSILAVTSLGKWLMPDFVAMEYDMKPDRSKVVMGMAHYPQINILDLDSGELHGYRYKALHSVTTARRIWYYASVCCDDEHVYALYNAVDLSDFQSNTQSSVVHVFDWNGDLTQKLDLNGCFDQIYLDNGYIYALNRRKGVVRYELSS